MGLIIVRIDLRLVYSTGRVCVLRKQFRWVIDIKGFLFMGGRAHLDI
jgi:hypothetical protein